MQIISFHFKVFQFSILLFLFCSAHSFSQISDVDTSETNAFKSNIFMIHFDPHHHIGASYMRKYGMYVGFNSSIHYKTKNNGEVLPSGNKQTSFYSGINAQGHPYAGEKQPELFHPNAINYSIPVESYSFLQGMLGVFVEAPNVLFKNLNIRFLANINFIRKNNVRNDYTFYNFRAEGEDGELFEFFSPGFSFERYFIIPFYTLEGQIDYTFYRNLFLGLNANLFANRHVRYRYYATLSLGVRF